MADEPSSGTGLKKKVAGLPLWAWPVIVFGGYLAYRWYENYEATQAANANTTSNTPLPAGTSTSSTTSTTAAPGTIAQWISAALGLGNLPAGYTQTQAYNDLASYSSGGCVSSVGAGWLGDVLSSIGTVPGVFPSPITICKTNPTTGTSGGGAVTATQAAYDQALSSYNLAAKSGATSSVLQNLYRNVLATFAVASGKAGSAQLRAAYDEALAAYNSAFQSHASPKVLETLAQNVYNTQSSYAGHAVNPAPPPVAAKK